MATLFKLCDCNVQKNISQNGGCAATSGLKKRRKTGKDAGEQTKALIIHFLLLNCHLKFGPAFELSVILCLSCSKKTNFKLGYI